MNNEVLIAIICGVVSSVLAWIFAMYHSRKSQDSMKELIESLRKELKEDVSQVDNKFVKFSENTHFYHL